MYTSYPKLEAFVSTRLNPNYTVSTMGTVGIAGMQDAIIAMAQAKGNKTLVHKLRSRMKTEYGTVRPARKCEALDPMRGWPACAELVRLTHPLYMC